MTQGEKRDSSRNTGTNRGTCLQSMENREQAAGLYVPIRLPGDKYTLHTH